MTRIYLTDQDYEVLNSGDMNEIKRLANDLRAQLAEIKPYEPYRNRHINQVSYAFPPEFGRTIHAMLVDMTSDGSHEIHWEQRETPTEVLFTIHKVPTNVHPHVEKLDPDCALDNHGCGDCLWNFRNSCERK